VKEFPPEQVEAELLARVAQRDREAFSQLYDLYATPIFSVAMRILQNPKDAEDVLQEVCLQIWENAKSFNRALGKPFTWVMVLTRNKAIDRLRALERRYQWTEKAREDPLAASNSQETGNEIFTREKLSVIRSAVASLPLEQRQAIEMAFFGGMTQNEIAEALQQPLGTVKARIRRGMLKLRDALQQHL
jgi:RNA polymerase sigma-70 factor (ECF subfamily)